MPDLFLFMPEGVAPLFVLGVLRLVQLVQGRSANPVLPMDQGIPLAVLMAGVSTVALIVRKSLSLPLGMVGIALTFSLEILGTPPVTGLLTHNACSFATALAWHEGPVLLLAALLPLPVSLFVSLNPDRFGNDLNSRW